MLDDDFGILPGHVDRMLFGDEGEIFVRIGLFVQSFPAGAFHDVRRIEFGDPHHPHAGAIGLYRILAALQNMTDELLGIRADFFRPRQETLRVPTENGFVLLRHVLGQGGVTAELIVVPSTSADSFTSPVDFNDVRCRTDRTTLPGMGIMHAVEEAFIFDMVIEPYFCFFPVGVFVSSCRQCLQERLIYLFKGRLSITFQFLKRTFDEFFHFFGNRLVDFSQTEELVISQGCKDSAGNIAHHILIGGFIFWFAGPGGNQGCPVMPRHFTVAFIQYRVNSIRGGHGGFGIVGNGDFGNSAEVFIGACMGVEPVCQLHILISTDKGISAGRENGDKYTDLFDFSCFRVCIAKGLSL